jgi:glucose-6-phosphate 1-dehydrogenase
MQQLLVEESWRVLQPLLESPPPVHSCTPGTWGPEAAVGLAGPYRGWHGPWVPQ